MGKKGGRIFFQGRRNPRPPGYLKINIKNMSQLIKEVLTNKEVRNSAALNAVVAEVMKPGLPWA